MKEERKKEFRDNEIQSKYRSAELIIGFRVMNVLINEGAGMSNLESNKKAKLVRMQEDWKRDFSQSCRVVQFLSISTRRYL